jgi:hypothetical protein
MQTLAMDTRYEAPSISLTDHEIVDSTLVWFLILIIILLALGVTLVLGALAWCIIHGHGSLSAVGSKSGWFKIWIACTR